LPKDWLVQIASFAHYLHFGHNELMSFSRSTIEMWAKGVEQLEKEIEKKQNNGKP